jgi:hypothetical protein
MIRRRLATPTAAGAHGVRGYKWGEDPMETVGECAIIYE